MIWLRRMALAALAAAAMSFVGVGLLPNIPLRPAGYATTAAVSVALWLCLSPLVYRQSLGVAISVGLMSPLVAVALASPIVAFVFFVDIRYWLVFPTGALTGVLVRACLSVGQGQRKAWPEKRSGE